MDKLAWLAAEGGTFSSTGPTIELNGAAPSIGGYPVRTLADAAGDADTNFDDGDPVSLLVSVDSSNWALYVNAIWDDLATDEINLASAEVIASHGIIVDTDTVAVYVAYIPLQVIMFNVSDDATALTTGADKATFRMPVAMYVTDIRASVTTAPTGDTLIIDINASGTSLMTTNKVQIDATEFTSVVASTAPGITNPSVAEDAEITVDIDQIGSTVAGAGLKVSLIGYRR